MLRTKTSSVHPQVLEPGHFFWTWELLLPTNAQVMLFPQKSRTQEFSLEGELPSGTTYGNFLGDPQAFQYKLKGTWQARTSPRNLPHLVAEGLAAPETWDLLLEKEAAEIARLIREGAAQVTPGDNTFPDVSSPALFRNLKVWDDVVVSFSSLTLPDRRLYDLISRQYLETQALLQEQRAGLTVRNRVFELKEKEKLQWLEKYGQMMAAHPQLLDLWKLSKDIPELKPLLPGVQ